MEKLASLIGTAFAQDWSMESSRMNPRRVPVALGLALLASYFVWAPTLAVRPLIVTLAVLVWRHQRGVRVESMLLAFTFGIFAVFVWHVAFVSGLGGYLVATLTVVALFRWPIDPGVSTFENLRTKWRSMVRCFGPPGSRGTMHARWFAVGLWLAYLPLKTMAPSDTERRCFAIWVVTSLVTWAVRWVRPRWDPAVLMRVSLFTSGAHMLWMRTAGGLPRLNGSHFGMVAFGAMTLAVVWQLHERLTLARLYAGTHPRWVLHRDSTCDVHSVHARSRLPGTYRCQARGDVVGWVPKEPTCAGKSTVRSMVLFRRAAGTTLRFSLAVGVCALYTFMFVLMCD